MATKTHPTVEFAFDTNTTTLATANGLGSATRLDFPAITVYMPETGITFKSVRLEVSFRTSDAGTARNFLGVRLGIKLGAVAFDDVDYVSGTVSGFVGFCQNAKVTRDVTSYFQTNWSGTSMACQVGFACSTNLAGTVNNITAKLLITYTYDDSSTTYIKTARIPIQSSQALLTNTLTEIGVSGTTAAPSNQIPALNTFLPESSKTYRQAWIEIVGSDARATSTNFNLQIQIDSGATINRSTLVANNQDAWFLDTWIYDTGTYSPASAHAFKLAGSVTNRFQTVGAILHVTYEYDPASTTHLVSLKIPVSSGRNNGAAGVNGITTADADVYGIELWVEEPGTITLVQSGLWLWYHSAVSASSTWNIWAGGQAERGYTVPAYTLGSGAFQRQLVHRTDHGTSPWTLTRGQNKLTWSSYSPTDGAISIQGGFVILNYTCGKYTGGCANHNMTCCWAAGDQLTSGAATGIREVATASIRTPTFGSRWFMQAYGIETDVSSLPGAGGAESLWVQVLSGENVTQSGWLATSRPCRNQGGVESVCDITFDYTGLFERTDQATTSILVPTTARKLKTWANATVRWDSMAIWTTHHTNTFTVSGTVTGFPSGDGSGITVDVYTNFNRSKVAEVTTTTGGAYTATVYDNTNTHFAEAWVDSTHVGRSDNTTPS